MFKNRKENYPLYDIRPLGSLRQLIDEGASMYKDKAAFKFRENRTIKSVSYKDLKTDIDSLGTAFCALGIEADHVAIIGNNCFEWALSYLTVLLSEGVVVPVDKDLSNDDTKYILQNAEVTTVIYSKSCEEKVDAISEGMTSITHFICMSEPAVGDDEHYSLFELMERGKKLLQSGNKSFVSLTHNTAALKELLFTSGTTGRAKGVMLSENCLCYNIENSQKLMWISDVCLSVLPYHHAYESTCGILTMLHRGMTICVNETLRTLMPNFKVYKPTEVQLVPLFLEKMYRTIWDKIDEKGKTSAVKALIKTSNGLLKVGIDMRKVFFKEILSNFGGELKSIICGGAPLKPYIPYFFTSIGITLINGYGISECGPLVTVNRPEFHDYESVGLPLPGLELRIDNPNESGEGEVCVKGPNVMIGYYKNREATDKVLIDGWFHTGDIGRIGHDGFLFVTGRVKNVIILANGKNVYPEELEDKLCAACEYIEEVVVSAVDKNNGEGLVLGAEIYLNKDRIALHNIQNPEEAIRKAVSLFNNKEAPYKSIKSISFRDTEFDKTTTKKIKRNYTK